MSKILEHNTEPEPGMPQPLPEQERLLWQGSADFRSLLFGSFHFSKLLVYFGVVLVVHFVVKARELPLGEALTQTGGFALLAGLALGIMAVYAYYLAKATMYSITDRRVVLRTGVALSLTVNLPFKRIESADLRLRSDGSGDLSLLPEPGSRASWLLLWPMVKPFRLFRVQPVLRGIADAEAAGEVLAEALGDALSREEVTPEPLPERRTQPLRSSDEPTRGFRPYPTIPLAAMVSLVVIAFVGASWSVLSKDDAGSVDAEAIEASIELYFEDSDDGSVLVREAGGGTVIDVLDPGTNGFVRATLRTLVRARAAVDASDETPFVVGQGTSGRIFLIDPVSERRIDLRAFGPTNAEAFARYLDDGAFVSEIADAAAETTAAQSDTTIALKIGETE